MGLRHRSFGMQGMVCALIVPKLQAWVYDIFPAQGKAWCVCVPCAKIKRGRECALCQNPMHGIHDISPSQVKAWCTPCGKIPIVGLRHLSFGRQGMACVLCQASIYDIHSPTIAITDYANGWRSNCSEFVTIQTAKLISSRVSITFITTTCI